MSKGGSQTVTQNVDPQTAAYVNQMRQAASGYAGLPGTPTYRDPARASQLQAIVAKGGILGSTAQRELDAMAIPGAPGGGATLPQGIQDAQAQYGQYANAGSQGLAALTGGPNPFMNQYLSQMNPMFDQLRQQAMNAADERATELGAFGGSRNDVTRGVALGDIANTQAGLNFQAFNDSQMRALALANLGYGSQARSAFLPQMYGQGQINLLNSAIGPYGTTQTQQTQNDPFSQLLGTGLTIASLVK